MKTIREDILARQKIEPTFDGTQKAIVEELNKWFRAEHKTLDEQWNHLLAIKEFSQFVVDYADRDSLASAFKQILDAILNYGKPFDKKIPVSENAAYSIFSVAISLPLCNLEGILMSLVTSALDGYEEKEKQKHKSIAKMRVDLQKRDLFKRIEDGEL
jgi:hypothetical protein